MRKTFIFIIKSLAVFIAAILIYLFLGYFLPFIPVQAEATPEPKVIRGFIKTNGMHTDVVVPVKSTYIDWSEKFPFENTLSKSENYRYLSIGWGDKGFYLNTPTWADLKFSTAFKAAFWLGDAAVHATYYDKIEVNDSVKSFVMTERQYLKLIRFVDETMEKDAAGNYIFIPTDAQYDDNDAFYEANGSYSFLFTCNTWTNNALKVSGQKAALWTPSDFGIFRHYP